MEEEKTQEQLTNDVKLGRNAEESRKYLGPYLQREIDLTVRRNITCEPTYDNLLDNRNYMKAIYKLDAISLQDAKKGRQAREQFSKKSKRKKQ